MNMTIEQNPSRFDMFVHVKRKLATFFWVTTLDIITTQGRVYPSFFYRSLDMCHYFANPSMDVIFALIYGELSRSGRWLKKCPVEKVSVGRPIVPDGTSGVIKTSGPILQGVYAVQNFSLNTELFPTYTPELKYNITIQILHAPDARNAAQKIELVKVHVFGKMDSTNDVKRRRQKIGKRTKIPPEHPIKPNAFLISSKVVQPITTK